MGGIFDFMGGLPVWVLVVIFVPPCLFVAVGVVAAWRDDVRRRRGQQRQGLERAARFAAGSSTGQDVEHLIYERWGAGPVMVGPHWNEENGLIPYTQGRKVRLAVREPTEFGEGRGTHSPAVIARWVLEEVDPMLLVGAVGADLPDATLVAYLDGDTDRRTLEMLTAIRKPA